MNQDQKKKEYRTLLIELYKENLSYLHKAIFSVSTLAIPFLFQVLSKKSDDFCSAFLLTISLFGFVVVILLQVSSLRNALDGCDKSLEQKLEFQEEGKSLFNKVRVQDKWRDLVFAFSLILTVFAIVIKTLN